MPSLTCENVTAAASDLLDEVLAPAEASALEAHLAVCDSCPTYLDQLRSTIEVLARRPDVTVPDDFRKAVDGAIAEIADSEAAGAFTEQSQYLCELAMTVSSSGAEDLVQATFARALDEGSAAFGRDRLAQILLDIASESEQDEDDESRVRSVYDHDGSADARVEALDTDADAAELYYPAFYSDGPDAGAWIESPNAWPGDSRILSPEDDVATDELYQVVDAALQDLPAFDAAVVTMVDIEGTPSDVVAGQLNRSEAEVRAALHRGRNHLRGVLDQYETA